MLQELQEAEEEARIAIENIVIPRQQPIELRPRPPAVVELQVMDSVNFLLTMQHFHLATSFTSSSLPLLDLRAETTQDMGSYWVPSSLSGGSRRILTATATVISTTGCPRSDASVC